VVQILARVETWFKVSAPPVPLANLATMITLTSHCHWEDETARERTGHPTSYAKAKKMKSLTLHKHVRSRATLRDCSSPIYRKPSIYHIN